MANQVRIGTVWDRTTDVLGGRTSILAGIAILLLLVPTIVVAALAAVAIAQGSTLLAALSQILQIAVLAFTIWSALAITAVATDPAVTRDQAIAIGRRRLLPALGIFAVIALAALLLAIPAFLLFASAGFDWTAAQQGLPQTDFDVGRAGLGVIYALVYGLAAIWLSAKLVPLMGVIVNERLGLRAIARSFALTRGSTLKLIGVLILYGIVLLVVMTAVVAVVGIVFRLILGAEALASLQFVVACASAVLTAVFGVLQYVFSARFYVAAIEARDMGVPTK